tara:strand:+ start:19072 stop:19281 length:210 start_codon:yes stop_codon:yes gene_type:complete
MIYKLEYQFNDDPSPHQRYYTALSPDIATAMFEATCEDGSLSGESVTLLSVEEVAAQLPPEPIEACTGE